MLMKTVSFQWMNSKKAAETCETTFDPFDSDGDGVPDIDDQFPDDPDESKDADGDGIGDNADFAPSVANDVVYGAGGAMLIVLIGLLILFVRGAGGSRQQIMDEEWNKTDAFSEQMMQMNNQYGAPAPTQRHLPWDCVWQHHLLQSNPRYPSMTLVK